MQTFIALRRFVALSNKFFALHSDGKLLVTKANRFPLRGALTRGQQNQPNERGQPIEREVFQQG